VGVEMVGRGSRWWRRCLAVVPTLACVLALLATSPAGGSTTGASLRVLQLNLCDSGIAGCYTGHSVARAAQLIRVRQPDVVTLNEVCEPDVTALAAALGGDGPERRAVPVFEPAVERRTGGPVHCRDGARYGIGLVVRLPGVERGGPTYHGIYPMQDNADPEERVWLCLRASGELYACTTHLASTLPSVALRQCRYLLGTVLPQLVTRDGYQPTLIGGDFNLRERGIPALGSCEPPRYHDADDGGVQHVVTTRDLGLSAATTLDMARTTDHPGLLVTVTLR
jgi:endonuclease/exonuclease/phosphatase family metal-dependent hydrolase